MQGRVARRAGPILTCSQSSRADICRDFGVRPDNVHVIPLGVDTRLFRPGPAKAARPTVVFAGKVVPNKGAEVLAEKGAGEIYIGATHGLFSGKAVQKLEEAPIKQVVVTNTVPIPEEKQFDKLVVLSIAPIIASALRAVFEDTSVSEIFHGENQP